MENKQINFKKCPVCGGKLATVLENELLRFNTRTCLECYCEPDEPQFQDMVKAMGVNLAAKAWKHSEDLVVENEDDWDRAKAAAVKDLEAARAEREKLAERMKKLSAFEWKLSHSVRQWEKGFQWDVKELETYRL